MPVGRLPSSHTLCRRRFPLAPTYTSTFHSCQGLTMDHVGADLTEGIFTHGRLYTAILRIRNRTDAVVRLPPQILIRKQDFPTVLHRTTEAYIQLCRQALFPEAMTTTNVTYRELLILGPQVTIALRIWMRLLEWQQTAETHAWSDVSSDGGSDLWIYRFHQFKRLREATFPSGVWSASKKSTMNS